MKKQQKDSIDLTYGAKLIGQNEDDAKKMLQLFADSLDSDWPPICAAYKTKDYDLLKTLLHRFRGGMAYCGVPALHETGEALEDYLKAGAIKDSELGKLFSEFDTEIQQFKLAFIQLKS